MVEDEVVCEIETDKVVSATVVYMHNLLLRSAMLAWYMLSSCVCLSICVCLCLSRAVIVSEWLNLG